MIIATNFKAKKVSLNKQEKMQFFFVLLDFVHKEK
jgi:hypothetical protein